MSRRASDRRKPIATETRPAISVVIPAYNSEPLVPELVRRLHDVLGSVSRDYEVILVDDGSRDATWNVIQRLAGANEKVRGVRMMRNYGQHNALLCGIRLAEHDLIVTMDDDLQHPPEEIPRLIEALTAETDVVYGSPTVEQHGLWRDIASQTTKLALQASMGAPIARKAGAFRLFRTHLRNAFARYDGPYVSIDVLLTWATVRFAAVDVRHDERRAGRSNYTLRMLIRHSFNMITGFSVWPLQLASMIGFFFTVFGTLALIVVVVRYFLNGGVVPGFSFLASVISIFAGAQLFALGIMGEYLARMHLRVMQRPVYAVRELAQLGYEAGSAAEPPMKGVVGTVRP
ncbi:MAG TPA: glycosyltransferase family 2 protein [Candidatus Dormibacteraeota bacterium]|nr:glycosyltransferase family 2 protein [Candidatus Dormibacteraeota bacterium]